jgi:hypothetical protein
MPEASGFRLRFLSRDGLGVCNTKSSAGPHVLLRGHEPRRTGWTDPERVAAYVYNTATGEGLDLRVPDAPFVIETFCMEDHGIVSGYRYSQSGAIEPILQSPSNIGAENWGLSTHRSTLYAVADAFSVPPLEDVRRLIHGLTDKFWCRADHEAVPKAGASGKAE